MFDNLDDYDKKDMLAGLWFGIVIIVITLSGMFAIHLAESGNRLKDIKKIEACESVSDSGEEYVLCLNGVRL